MRIHSLLGAILLAGLLINPDHSLFAQERKARQPATIVVKLPDIATLKIADHVLSQTGAERTFSTPAIVPGWTYHYTVEANWTEDGKDKKATRIARFQAGQRVLVDLTGPEDVFDLAAQKALGKDVKKILFVGDKRPHGARGNHEFVAGPIYFARTLNIAYPECFAAVTTYDKFPKDLSDIDAVVVLINDGGPAVNPAMKEAMARGAGFMAIHYAVEVKKGEQGDAFLHWMGGYFEANWSVNPHWTPKFLSLPDHEVTRGVKPFTVKDEWYYHMRFVDGMKGVTPILTALPELKTIKGDGKKTFAHEGNPAVYQEVAEGKPQHVAWAYSRPDGGRGFGFTGYHYFDNLRNDSFRTLLLNAIAWTAKLEVPPNGVPSVAPTKEDLANLIKETLRVK
jgi:uncharacterized protein (TIGR03000 family)